MTVNRKGCLQAVGNHCEFVGNDREQSACLVSNESEWRNVMFASRGDSVCKLLHLVGQLWSQPRLQNHRGLGTEQGHRVPPRGRMTAYARVGALAVPG